MKKLSEALPEGEDDGEGETESDDELSGSMPVIEEDNELQTDQVQYRASPVCGARRKPRPKSLDFQMMGRRDIELNQCDFELAERLHEEFLDEDEYY